jgi:hypothetical protein
MRKFTNKHSNSGFIHNLGIKAETFRKQETNRNSDSGTDKKCFECKLSDQLKMETNTKDIELLVNQSPAVGANVGTGQNDTKDEEASGFYLDYMPLCCEEDLELIAYYFSKDKEKQSS